MTQCPCENVLLRSLSLSSIILMRISRIIRCMRSLNLTSIISMRISSISMRIIKSSLIWSRRSLILSSLSSRMMRVMLRRCRGWSTRPDRTAMEGGLLTSRFYLASMDTWHAGYGSMPM